MKLEVIFFYNFYSFAVEKLAAVLILDPLCARFLFLRVVGSFL